MCSGPEDAIVVALLDKGRLIPTIMLKPKAYIAALAGLILLASAQAAFSQEVSMALLQPAMMQPAPAPMAKSTPLTPAPLASSEHRFWDTKNRFLFGAVAGMAGADFAVTHANLSSGGQELNPVTRIFSGSTAGLAANFVGETAGVMGISYFFHKTGHHKLERIVPLVNIAASTGAVAYGLSHR